MAEQKNNSKFAPKSGIFKAQIISINPTLEQANTLRGTTWDRPVEYLSKGRDGNDRVLVEIWLKDIQAGTLFQQKYYISNKLRASKSNINNLQFGNATGQVSWGTSLEQLSEKSWWDSSRIARQLLIGEEGLVEFMAAWIVQGSRPSEKFPMTDVNVLVDTNKLFADDFSQLQAMVDRYTTPVICLATINEYNAKQKQALWPKVLPGSEYFWNKVMSKDTSGIVGGWFSGIEDKQFGCKDEYVLEPINGAKSNIPSFTAPTGKNVKTETTGSGYDPELGF